MTKIPDEFWLPEVKAAAEWWLNALVSPGVQDNGDAFQSGFATMAMLGVQMRIAPMTDEEQDKVRESLRAALQDRCLTPKPWDPEPWREHDPTWASAMRGVGVDYGPEPVLADAVERALGKARAEQFSLMWPIKTHMWIDPGSVRVRHGYGAETVEIYKRPDPGQEP